MVTSSIGSSRSPFSPVWNSTRGRRDRKLEAFAAHGFDQHAELQFAAAGDFEIAVAGFVHLDRDIAFGLAQQALADDAALHLVAFAARKRASR